MKEDGETRELLMEKAKREFLEKGYMKSSLRRICSEAGVTTGALYFFFKDKEDLFGALVDRFIAQLSGLLEQHFEEENALLSQIPGYEHSEGDHDHFAELLVRHLYDNYDAVILLVKKSQGSRYENFPDRITELLEKRYFFFLSEYAERHGLPAPEPFFVHFIVHTAVDSLVQLLLSEKDVERAVVIQKKLLEFVVAGSTRLILSREERPPG